MWSCCANIVKIKKIYLFKIKYLFCILDVKMDTHN